MPPCTPSLLRSIANIISGYAWDAAGVTAKLGYSGSEGRVRVRFRVGVGVGVRVRFKG